MINDRLGMAGAARSICISQNGRDNCACSRADELTFCHALQPAVAGVLTAYGIQIWDAEAVLEGSKRITKSPRRR